MANQWFKFYGNDYLSDTKLLGMDANLRSCWLTLLCYASQENGMIKYLSETHLMIQSGVLMGGDEWRRTEGVLKRFEERKMISMKNDVITVLNWEKRQESYLTDAERAKKYRDKQKSVTTSRDDEVTNVTLEKNRIEENRREKRHASLDYLSKLPESDLKELVEKYDCSSAAVKRKAEQMANYCRAKGKIYKNYRAFLENGLDKDFGRRAKLQPKQHEIKPIVLDAEALARAEKVKAQIREMVGKTRV